MMGNLSYKFECLLWWVIKRKLNLLNCLLENVQKTHLKPKVWSRRLWFCLFKKLFSSCVVSMAVSEWKKITRILIFPSWTSIALGKGNFFHVCVTVVMFRLQLPVPCLLDLYALWGISPYKPVFSHCLFDLVGHHIVPTTWTQNEIFCS